MKSIMPESVGL